MDGAENEAATTALYPMAMANNKGEQIQCFYISYFVNECIFADSVQQ